MSDPGNKLEKKLSKLISLRSRNTCPANLTYKISVPDDDGHHKKYNDKYTDKSSETDDHVENAKRMKNKINKTCGKLKVTNFKVEKV